MAGQIVQQVIQLLPIALRGNISFGHVGDAQPTPFSLAAGQPQFFDLRMDCATADWLAQTGVMECAMERSLVLNNPQPGDWGGFGGSSLGLGALNQKTGLPGNEWGVGWDGQACLVRGTIITPIFNYGVTIVLGL